MLIQHNYRILSPVLRNWQSWKKASVSVARLCLEVAVLNSMRNGDSSGKEWFLGV
jgi:hypothetical protein